MADGNTGNISWDRLYAIVDDPLSLIRDVDQSLSGSQKALRNYQLSSFFRLLDHMVEFLRPTCKFVPAYSHLYTNVLDSILSDRDLSEEVPDEIISYMIFSMEPGTMGGSTAGSTPRAVKPREFGETQKVGNLTFNTFIQPYDSFVDFFFFAKDDESRLDLIEWFDEKVTTLFRPILKLFGVERFIFEEHGEDIEVRSFHPQLFIPRSRYYVRIQRQYIDYEPIIRGFYAEIGQKSG